MCTTVKRPSFDDPAAAETLAARLYGMEATAKPLAGYDERNFLLTDACGRRHVLKISSDLGGRAHLEAQHSALVHLQGAVAEIQVPAVVPTVLGESIAEVPSPAAGPPLLVRMLTYVEGEILHELASPDAAVLQQVGRCIGLLDAALTPFFHPGTLRHSPWDLQHAAELLERTAAIAVPATRRMSAHALFQLGLRAAAALRRTRRSVIHGDGNSHNLLVRQTKRGDAAVCGVIDFGDMTHSHPVCDVAIAAAYACMGVPEPLEAAAAVVAGYHRAHPLTEIEVELIFPLLLGRLSTTLTLAAVNGAQQPGNSYVCVSVAPATAALTALCGVSPEAANNRMRAACHMTADTLGLADESRQQALALRRRYFPRVLSLSHREPIHMVRGSLQYLFDDRGRRYLDACNNVPHVGHCHPRVVEATSRQGAALNTNTRYISPLLTDYASRLLATMPPHLEVCVFVCSGSEANDLALRMARSHTGARDVIVLQGAYHGNTSSVLEISPYKLNGPGGRGCPSHVHVVAMPDGFRGRHRGHDEATGALYASEVQRCVREQQRAGQPIAAIFCEPILGCGGQVVPPPGFLRAAYQYVRESGGVCVADEVQVGFGRVGSHFWAFEAQDAVPDIVTLGKPMGNGHPIAAVVTSRAIIDRFDGGGMEFFSTFGGTNVSMAAAHAVLDVIEDEQLRAHAGSVGQHLRAKLRQLQDTHERVGDVRGAGLFLGVELVQDRKTLVPAAAQTAAVAEAMKQRGVLVGVDGPHHNVLKIKPPLCFSAADADFLCETLSASLGELGA